MGEALAIHLPSASANSASGSLAFITSQVSRHSKTVHIDLLWLKWDINRPRGQCTGWHLHGPGVVESRAKLADPNSESLASHLSLDGYRERRRTLVHLCG